MRERPGHKRRRTDSPVRVETSSGGVVFRRVSHDTVFLLIRDPYGNWGLPKGHVEGGETPVQAAVREVAEETALNELSVVAQLPTIDWYFRDGRVIVHKFCHFFLIESPAGEPCPQLDEGITECIWLPISTALERVSYANAREVLRAAGDRLSPQPHQPSGDASSAA